MIRPLAAFAVLFAGGVACVSLLPSPAKTVAPRSVVAMQLRNEAEPAVPSPKVRVVYPAPQSDRAQAVVVHTAGVDPAPTVTSTSLAQPAVYPQVTGGTSPGTSATVPPNEAVPASPQGINLNTATIEALNQIPGAGHIGRTIASHRPYRSVEDLLAKRVIRKSVYDVIKNQVAAE